MFRKNDFRTFTKFYPLSVPGLGVPYSRIGTLYLEYEVVRYENVQLKDAVAATGRQKRQFLLHCTQKITIWNPVARDVSPSNPAPPGATFFSGYENYPALLHTSMVVPMDGQGLRCHLMNYSPKTVNTKVESSQSTANEKARNTGVSKTNTVGSSTSQTNSFSASVSAGLNFDHSSTYTEDQSTSTGSDSSASLSQDLSGSDSMSLKDWGAYATVDPVLNAPVWTFGQEYPLDFVQYRATDGWVNPNNPNQVCIFMPQEIVTHWKSKDGLSFWIADPPSQLSMFGLSFSMKASWLLILDNDAPDQIEIEHTVNYFTASHFASPSNDPNQPPDAYVFFDANPTTLTVGGEKRADKTASTTISLDLMALESLGTQSKAAIIGFIPSKFVVAPVAAQGTTPGTPFKILSTTNDLMILDKTGYPQDVGGKAGFTSSQTELTANFTKACNVLKIILYFKVIDAVSDYTLFMKHWKTGTPVQLTFIINQDTANPITKYVDAQEAGGGENNLLSISLRNQDYASVDYHDYLQLGLNSIEVSISPAATEIVSDFLEDPTYEIRAISIEKV